MARYSNYFENDYHKTGYEVKPLPRWRIRPVAYCSSYKCSGRDDGHLVVKENVLGLPTNCPDCNEFLFWITEKVHNAQK